MAGSITVSEEDYGSVKKIKWEWTSSAGGAAGGSSEGLTSAPYNGVLERLVTEPGSGGVQPSDNYDIVINDEDGVDVLVGAGANRDNVNTEQVLAANIGVVANDKLDLVVSNAGNAKQGTVYLYLR